MSAPASLNLNITNDQLFLINILNTMYNDNLRQINSLTTSNNEIRTIITNLLSNLNNRNQLTNRYRNRQNNYRENNTPNSNIYLPQNRGHVNNSSYTIQDYRIPHSYVYSWIDNSDITVLEPRSNANRNGSNSRTTNFRRDIQRFLEPVEVFPTQSQIEIATRRVRYSDIVTPINRACPISLENFNESDTVSVIRFCGHIFNTENLTTWFRTNCRCPVCRYDIRNYNSSSSTNLFDNVTNVIPSTNSQSLNGVENEAHLNEERNTQPNANNASVRSNTTSYINNLLNNIINDVNSPDIENLGNFFSDSSGNFTTDVSNPTVLFSLLQTFNRGQR